MFEVTTLDMSIASQILIDNIACPNCSMYGLGQSSHDVFHATRNPISIMQEFTESGDTTDIKLAQESIPHFSARINCGNTTSNTHQTEIKLVPQIQIPSRGTAIYPLFGFNDVFRDPHRLQT
jgi:hypothetical protein